MPAVKKSPLHLYLVMLISLVVASVLSVYPLSAPLAVYRPMWLIMVLIFWLIFQPTLIGVGLAFVIGLAADFLTDSRVGQQALCAVIVAFLIKFASGYLKQLSAGSVWVLAGICLFTYQTCLMLLHLMMQGIFSPSLLYAVVLSIFIWPLLVALMARYTH